MVLLSTARRSTWIGGNAYPEWWEKPMLRIEGMTNHIHQQRSAEMKSKASHVLLSALFLCVTGGACRNTPVAPTTPANHPPLISSIILFPLSIGPSDSAIVVCSATDPDGDTLVYDWISDGRLRLKGAPRGGYIFSSPRNSQTFYYATPRAPIDTALIRCYTRDQRGGQDGRVVALIMHS
jgi:hypothetical protein